MAPLVFPPARTGQQPSDTLVATLSRARLEGEAGLGVSH